MLYIFYKVYSFYVITLVIFVDLQKYLYRFFSLIKSCGT